MDGRKISHASGALGRRSRNHLVNTFMEWLRMDTEHVTAMQEILDRAEQMGILLAAVEQNNIMRAQEV